VKARETKVVLWSDFKRAAAVNTNWPLHKLSALDDLKIECLRRGLWREEGNHIRRGPFPPPIPEVSIRELSVQEDGDGITYLKIEPLHAQSVVYETGDSEPTKASSPVPTPSRFEATGLRYRFLAFDPADLTRFSAVKDWAAKLRLKYQGVAPPEARPDSEFFDPGAKYHVPANVPYTRYFLARLLQFQFHRALCRAAGETGPLNRCSIYDSKKAGDRLNAMLSMGLAKPWPEALEALTGEKQMDATAIRDYFAPLQKWLDEQNKGVPVGW
jgi:hypothetical protein